MRKRLSTLLATVFLWLAASTTVQAQEMAPATACESASAKLLMADAKRAHQWNWGWGSLYATAAVAQAGVALYTDDYDVRVGLWTGASKAALGTLNQMIFPNRVEGPGPGCSGLEHSLRQARRVERKRHNWFAHSSVVAANVAGFAVVATLTENYTLATTGSVIGTIVGETAIYTSPNRVRAAGIGVDTVTVVPQVRSRYSGFALVGTF